MTSLRVLRTWAARAGREIRAVWGARGQ